MVLVEDQLAGVFRGLEAYQSEQRVSLQAERTVQYLLMDACCRFLHVRLIGEVNDLYGQFPVHDGLAGFRNALVQDGCA